MSGLVVGRVIVEPVSDEAGDAIRDAFLRAGECVCGIAYLEPPRKMRRQQWRTGELIEHVYQHNAVCPGGVHTVIDTTYIKEGRA